MISSEINKHFFQKIAFRDMSLSFDDKIFLFKNINFEFPIGEIIFINGVNGSGCSSLLKIFAGLIIPSHGQYLINDVDICSLSFKEFLPFRLRIGYGFDMGGLLNNKTLEENLLLPLQYHKVYDSEEKTKLQVYNLLEIFGIHQEKSLRPAFVSRAIRKACCLARTFVMDPEMILLDDPTVGLRPEARNGLIHLIQEKRKQQSVNHIFFTSSDEDFFKKIDGNIELLIHAEQFDSFVKKAVAA